ncbi:porin family protein [Maribacter sp. CXY002]|uniref:porin family protein n=1 Tax=Maribacter luteocoastalis TaxID=3407671 RepID=UPI003B675CE6
MKIFSFKSYVVVLLILFTANSIIGQEKVSVGIKFGSNITTRLRNTEGSFNYTPGISFHLGSFVKIPLNEKLGVQPEILYSSRAFYSKIDIEDFAFIQPSVNSGEYRALIRDNYLSIPISLNIRLNQTWIFQTGPQFGFLLNTVTKDKSKEERLNTEDVNFEGDFKLDIGPLVGLMFKPNENWYFQGRCYLGFGELLRKTEFEERSGMNDNWQDLVFQLSVGYTLF